ncbi:MAG: NAD(P)(+) transhydrogenase (Re/Si-specific) subunit beta, partial [Pseudomonadota bacterium]
MGSNLTALLYVVAAIFFILALRGLSSPETSRSGNRYGMIGMGLAVFATLFSAQFLSSAGFGGWFWVIVAVAAGAIPGAMIARRIAMTEMPQLVAFFHALVGMAAVLIAWAAFLSPQAFGIGEPGQIEGRAIVEMAIGVVVGAITFSGSVIANRKLSGKMSGKPILLPARHIINLAIGAVVILLTVMLIGGNQSPWIFAILT